jgi:hypothetical protein
MEQREIERLKALKVLNSHFRHEPKFEHLTDRQVKCVLDAMQEFRKPDVMRSVCRSCGGELVAVKTYGYDECLECGKTFRQTDA